MSCGMFDGVVLAQHQGDAGDVWERPALQSCKQVVPVLVAPGGPALGDQAGPFDLDQPFLLGQRASSEELFLTA